MNTWRQRLFPHEPRVFPGKRWLDIGLRSLHLVGIAGIGGGFLFSLPASEWLPFWHLALTSGGLLILLYLWSSGNWLLQLKGQVIVLKLLLLALAGAMPVWRAPLFMLIVVLSAVIAHAPGRVRGFRWIGPRYIGTCRQEST